MSEIDIDRDRIELWGFAVGDRVRVVNEAMQESAKGLFGKVTWIGGCSIAHLSQSCRTLCQNIQITDMSGMQHLISPALLIHVD